MFRRKINVSEAIVRAVAKYRKKHNLAKLENRDEFIAVFDNAVITVKLRENELNVDIKPKPIRIRKKLELYK